ncbi:hypothetical protein OESDEN_01221 [Oesophagostomum dentatum]|uniref:Uncharacterized protein n=1 Tax=Oesophagostomum dentatum TaxID=61180 RepID=A0A0B1TSH9_OESDE|nr:hypothetical protein OESDEN_01221 [Oesophagostomum dentatum]
MAANCRRCTTCVRAKRDLPICMTMTGPFVDLGAIARTFSFFGKRRALSVSMW